jgi:hypothetical protein
MPQGAAVAPAFPNEACGLRIAEDAALIDMGVERADATINRRRNRVEQNDDESET